MLSLAVEPQGRSLQAPTDELGEVFTRRWVVDLILDLAGYTEECDLASKRAMEPACGQGAFLGPIIDRLLRSASRHGRSVDDLASALRALDLSELNVERARKLATGRLVDAGITLGDAERLARNWIVHGDFLLDRDVGVAADFVLGNPPYIRLENVPPARSAAYRATCPTMRGRSDVYVGFIERGLGLLSDGGVLGFIVADRGMHNQYGAALRQLIAAGYAVEAIVEMHDSDAFEDEVSAYPAITVIRRAPQSAAVLAATDSSFGPAGATRLRSWATGGRARTSRQEGFRAARLDRWFPGDELWPSDDPERLAVLTDLETRFRPLEDRATGTRVGIGVASGADGVYITRDPALVDADRLMPLVTSADITSGQIEWSGTYLVNPWEGGELVSLAAHPRLAAYLEGHEDKLRGRHVAKKRAATWYRTIDRVDPALLEQPKLLLPDIKAASHPVLDDGRLYPHHNLYFVTSDRWDLEVLGGLLLSEVANLFVGAYCVKMRGGCYRFQAQYLRQIRVPEPASVRKGEQRALARAFRARDVKAATAAACAAYDIDALPGWT